MRLILGVDDSPCSKAAVEFVRGMVWPAGSTVTVVCAVPLILSPVPAAYVAMAEQFERLHQEQRAAAEKHVAAVLADLAAALEAKASVQDGDPRLALVDSADKEKADLVVVGSHGRTGLAKLVMGSVASYVTTHAPCSVLVVRDKARAKT